MMDLLLILPAFLLTIGLLVTVHEFGHYWVARKMGVKVLRFSIGFGKPLWTKVAGNDRTEYVVAALPLGGYVKMLDEREGDVPEEELGRAFNRQNVWKRIAIVAAGPIANFLLAIVVYAIMFGTGVPAGHPYLDVLKDSPAAQAGFVPGDKVLAINEREVVSWEETRMVLLEEYLKNPVLQFTVQPQESSVTATRALNLSQTPILKDEGDFLDKTGLAAWSPEIDVVIGAVKVGGAAEAAGIQEGDKILAIDGASIQRASEFGDYIRAHPDQAVSVKIERSSGITQVDVTPQLTEHEGKQIPLIGVGIGERIPESVRDQLFFTQTFSPIDSLVRGVEKTWQMSVLTLKMIVRLVTGEVSLSNISGPITIAKFSGETAAAGLPYYLGFLAIISVSLGILNLLPIPMLDGGHLLYYLIELIKGSPVPEQVEEIGLRIGMAMIAGLMVLALYNDFMRLVN